MQDSGASTNGNVLEVDNLQINYETRKGDVEAIQGVSFKVGEAETVGLVGESGCGKSTIAFGIVNFLGTNGKIVDGSIRFQGEELVGRSQEELKKLRGDRISMVFQDPMQALNPSVRLGEQLAEVLTCHKAISMDEAWERSIQMLKRVNMPDVENVMIRYPHQISGGQQQRIVIAMAMLAIRIRSPAVSNNGSSSPWRCSTTRP
jgi:peptide/nickel transport system ATP-binding protein